MRKKEQMLTEEQIYTFKAEYLYLMCLTSCLKRIFNLNPFLTLALKQRLDPKTAWRSEDQTKCLLLQLSLQIGSWKYSSYLASVKETESNNQCLAVNVSSPPAGLLFGQWERPCDGRRVAVWAVREGAGSPGEERPLEAVLQEGDLHALALPCRRSGRHQPHLPANRQGRQVRRIPLRQGDCVFSLFCPLF